MTILTQNIALTAISGGTVTKDPLKTSWCQLSPTRMIVMYYQTSPAYRRFSIIDNTNGLSDASAPTIYNGVYNDTQTVSATANRIDALNSNTFLVTTVTSGVTTAITCNLDVYTVSGTAITKTYSTTWTGDNLGAYGWYSYSSLWSSPIVTASVGSNTVAIGTACLFSQVNSYYSFGRDYAQGFGIYRAIWDPVGKTLAVTQQANSYAGPEWGGGISYYTSFQGGSSFMGMNWYVNYGIGGVTIGCRYRSTSSSSTPANRGASLNTSTANGSNMFTAFVGNSWQGFMSNTAYYEDSIMSPTRMVRSTFKSAYYHSLTNTTQTSGTTWPVSATGDMTTAPYSLGVTPDYHVMIDSQHFAAPATNPFRMKFIRREDSNIVLPSAASTGAYGFTVNVPKVNLCWDKPQPMVMSTGDIIWAGLDTTSSNFQYVILKQPALPSN